MIVSPQTTATTHGKSPILRKNAFKKHASPKSASTRKKMHNIVLQGESKPGQRRQHGFCKNETADQFFFKIKKIQF